MSEEKSTKVKNVLVENMAELISPEGFQRYLFGTKKDGTPRAVYDIIKDYTQPKKKKKKHKKHKKSKELPTSYAFYLSTKDNKKKRKKDKKKKKKDKYWHI